MVAGTSAALCRARKIGGKDWLAWGTNLVLSRQKTDGSWKANVYPGGTAAINTCFALLFLRRSHLTEDLSQSLDFDLGGKKPPEERPGTSRPSRDEGPKPPPRP